jgi:5-methylthioadenosine/S-adenosylhomocysteine deaminase
MGEGVLEFQTNSFSDATKALEKAEAFIQKWQNHPLIVPATIFHSTYTCSKDTLKKIKALADKYNTPLTTHISESKEEVESVTKEQGLNPAQYLNSLNLLSNKLTGAHCVWLTNEDQELFAKNGTSIAHCPSSNLKLASGIAPIPTYIEKGINVALGTDGAASNNNLDMVEEMRLAALIHKGNNLDPTVINAKTALKMATINGAKALGLENKIGSIEVGKLADLLIIDTNNSFMTPIYDYFSAIVYSMNSHCIDSVLINGNPVMINRELLSVDEKEARQQLKTITEN